MQVLIADDNEDNRLLLEDILRGHGYTPLIARDGNEALEVVRQHKPDLVILDISMPGLNGFDVCARMKADPDTSVIPVLMLTALIDVDSRVRGLGLGADDYVTKPYSARELVARIDARLRAKSDTDALRAKERLIRQTFERFVPAAVVNRLLEQPETVRLGGALQQVTILFADLQGFTTLAEHTAPERLLAVLNAYHGLFVHHIQAQEGTLDKFIGDGVMALYNTPLQQADHALRAVQTALNIQAALPEFHAALEPACRLPINFGIHSGQAVIGMVGADEMMEFTAIGDAVNLASRLQDRGMGGEILVSEATYRQIAPQISAECLGPQAVRNRAAPVTIYRVTGPG